MAKLPARQKLFVLFFRRSGPDEILVIPREVRRTLQWEFPSMELEAGVFARDAALRLAPRLLRGKPMGDLDLGVGGTYRVNAGPRAGEWTERFHAVEMQLECPALRGEWLTHYDAKAEAGADAPRVREAVSRLRELAKLKP